MPAAATTTTQQHADIAPFDPLFDGLSNISSTATVTTAPASTIYELSRVASLYGLSVR